MAATLEELEKLLLNITRDFEKEIRYTGYEDIFHYTSPDAFLNILGKNKIELRFTRYDCVNDISEGNDIMLSYEKACKELLRDNEINNDFYNNICNLKIENKYLFLDSTLENGVPLVSSKTYTVFLCCFSLNEDSLPMWNYYVNNNRYQGYCLGFRNVMIQDYEREVFSKFRIEFNKVIYSESKKIEIIKKIIKDSYYYIRYGGNTDSILSYIIPKLFREAQFVFKSECFSHEQEIRLVLKLPVENIQTDNDQEFTVNYSTKHGYIVPYVTIPFEKYCLEKIVIAPLIGGELAVNTVKSMLKQRGYGDYIEVVSSKLPIRF